MANVLMKAFEWSNQFDIGVDDMNNEHKVLIGLMHELYEANERGEDKATLIRHLRKLADYTIEHFQHEEAYMAKIGYRQIEQHKRIHKDLLKKLMDFVSDYERTDGRLHSSFFDFLKLWLSAHIQHIDKKYAKES